jgi:hypothetical protein
MALQGSVAFRPVIFGAIFVVLLVLGAVAEFWIYDKAMWWHSDMKADRRNWTPPR